MGRAERTRVFSRFAAEKEIHTNRRYETNTTDYPADAFRRRGIRPKGRRHSHGRRRRHGESVVGAVLTLTPVKTPEKKPVFHLGLQGRGVDSVARLRRISLSVAFLGYNNLDTTFRVSASKVSLGLLKHQTGRADRNGRQGGQGAAHLAERRHGELQCRGVQGRGPTPMSKGC